jgi:hypothetical protein
MTVIYEGMEYYDDRLLVVHSAPCVLKRESDELFETTVYYETVPESADVGWCVIVRQNSGEYRLVDIFSVPSEPFAAELQANIESVIPLASLGGVPPPTRTDADPTQPPHSAFDYNRLFMSGGENAREVFVQSKEQFFRSVEMIKKLMNW